MAYLRRGLLILLLLLIALPGLLLALAATEQGSRALLQLVQSFVPVRIPADGIQGRLLGPLSLHQLHFQDGQQRIDVARLHLDWQPAALLQGHLHLMTLNLEGLDIQLPETSAQPETPSDAPIALPLRFTLDAFSLKQAQIRLGNSSHSIDSLQLSAHSRGRQVLISKFRLQGAKPVEQLTLQGGIELTAPYPISAGLALRAELPETGPIHVEALIKGNLEDYQVEAKADLSGPQLPASQISLKARGNLQQMQIETLNLASLKGQTRLHGKLGWVPQPHWDLQLNAEDLQPASHWPEIPGRLSLRLHSQGRLSESGPELEARIEQLHGTLNQRRLQGSGEILYAQGRLQVPRLQLMAGDNHLQVQGELAEQADFQLELDAKGLAELVPELKGSVTAKARLQGQLSDPMLSLHAEASNLAFQGHRAERLQAKLEWNPEQPERSHSQLRIEQLGSGALLIRHLTLEGPGNLASHQLQLDLASNQGDLQLALKGGYQAEEQAWQGQISSGQLRTPEFGRWSLVKAFTLNAGTSGLLLAPQCWRNDPASACLRARLDLAAAGAVEGEVELKAVPLALAQPYLSEGDTISGRIDASAQLSGNLDSPQIDLQLKLGEAGYSPKLKATTLDLELRQLNLNARYQQQQINGEYRFQLRANTPQGRGQWGQNSGQLRIELMDQPSWGNSRVQLELPDIAPLAVFVPAIDDLSGRLSVDLGLQGPLTRPVLKGQAQLSQAALKVPDIGIQIRDIQLGLKTADKQQLAISGQARSGKGQLELSGSFDPTAAQPRLSLNIKGQDFQVARIPRVEAEVSPDLQLRLADNRLSLGGRLHLPKAIVTLKEIPEGSVSLSEDAVILDDRDKTQKKELPPALIASQIQVSLGKEVSFSGFGLKTHIAGAMTVTTTPGHPPLGDGTLSLVNGEFKAFGQNLTLEQGRFLFAGPLNAPALDVRAVRPDLSEIKAGVLVTGQASNPRVEVFSIPARSTAETLSYLLTGSGLSDSNFDQAAAIRTAAWAMERAGANMLTTTIAKQLGLSEVNFGGDSIEDSALTLGKRLSPDLYLRYVQDLFDNESTVELAYKLNKMLDLKVYGGSNQGVDLYYHREK